MGIESLLPLAAPIIGGLLGGSSGGSSQSGTATTTNTATRDPRMDAILYGGSDGNGPQTGLLSQYQALGQKPQDAGIAQYGQQAGDYLAQNGAGKMADMSQTANNLMGGNVTAPGVQAYYSATTPGMSAAQAAAVPGSAAAQSAGAQVAAPSQNNVDLSGAYSNMINGNAGANPYLTSALQSGVDQTNTSYQKNQTDLTNNLQRNVLSGIRSNSVLAGQYGGSRQGIAEGNAISDYTNQLTNANLALAQTNSANTTGAQAAAYNSGQDRSLSAMNTLSGQQYATAGQNAQLNQQNSQFNAGQTQAQQNTNAANSIQNNQFNAGLTQAQQNTNAANYQQNNQFNAGLQQTAAAQNQQAQLATNQLNTNRQTAGLEANSGLLASQYQVAGNQDQYALNQAGKVNGLLSPYLGTNGSTTTQPLYSNTAGNVLGGATAGLGLANQLKGLLGNSGGTVGSSGSYANNDYLTS